MRKEEILINHKRTQRIIQDHELQGTCYSHKSRKISTYKGTVGKVVPNRMRRRFETNILHQKIVTDISQFIYFDIDDKGRKHIKRSYLDSFIDLFDRETISCSISKDAGIGSTAPALTEAIKITANCKYRRTFPSDQGALYQSEYYVSQMKMNKIFQSMSRKGN